MVWMPTSKLPVEPFPGAMDVVLGALSVWVFVPSAPNLFKCLLSLSEEDVVNSAASWWDVAVKGKRSSGPQRSESAEAFVTVLPKALSPSSTIRSCFPPATNSKSHTDIGACGLLCFAQGLPLSSCSWFHLRLNTTVEGRLSTFQTPGQDARI